jgi:hypothetical protein
MKTLKKMATLAVALVVLAACNKTETNPTAPDPNFEVIDCPKVNNPIKDLPWLAAIVENLAAQPRSNSYAKITMGNYKGKTVYIYEGLYRSNNIIVNGRIMDCSGATLVLHCGFAGCDSRYEPFKQNITNKKVIYQD